MRTRLEECLHGDVGTCGRPAIRAHSVQNSQNVMGLIAEDGLVVEAAPRDNHLASSSKKSGGGEQPRLQVYAPIMTLTPSVLLTRAHST